MREHNITQEDIESTYKVLEYLRDEWAYDQGYADALNNSHVIVQEFENYDFEEQLQGD